VTFDWDRDKAKRNKAKHGVDFELAKKFEFDTANIVEDDSGDYLEERYDARRQRTRDLLASRHQERG